jgi:beta-lactam-binding protein with PASTA domain
VRVPDLLGQPVERAEETLRRQGFTMDRVEGESPVAAGRVYAMAPSAGSVTTLPAHVTLHVSLGPPPPDSLLPDSTAVLPPDSLSGPR